MSKRESISRYNLIINKLRRQPSTFDEISDYLKLESEIQTLKFEISLRTFQRDVQDILSLYNIEIKFDAYRKVYYIKYQEQTEMNERILEAFDTFNALNISDRLSNHIHFEKHRPSGTENLYGLLHAIKNKVQIKFSYHKFWEEKISNRTVEPYALKEFKHRWYVLANDLNDKKVKSFALDRLSNLEITKLKFKFPADFNVEEKYRYCFGIINPEDEEPEEIVLSFEPFQGKYIKSLPLHESQEVLVDNEHEIRIKIKIYLTHDFLMEILSHGENVKVIEPAALIDQLKSNYINALNQY